MRDLQLRPKDGLTLIAIKRLEDGRTEITNISPSADDVIKSGDTLALLGSNERLARLDRVSKT